MDSPSSPDLISDALQLVRLSGAVLFRASLSAPWCFETGAGLMRPPRGKHLSVFHVVLDGDCWVTIGDGPAQLLLAGDAVILPNAHAHLLGDQPAGVPVPVIELIAGTPLAQLHDLNWRGDGACTRILCGFLSYERAAFAPLFDALPPLFVVRLAGNDAESSLDALLRYAEDEVVSRRPGSGELRLRMTELLFVESLRRFMAGLDDDEIGWLAAVRDPLVGRALGLLHASPQNAWTVTTLARAVGSSRSALADRFQALLDEPPMRYLNGWRMLLAARRLRDSRQSIESIAEAVGYASAAAFQRAFKKHFGRPAGAWRRDVHQGG